MTVDEAVVILTENWPHAKVTATMVDSYKRVMNDVPEEERPRLVARLVDDHDFLPSVYMVRTAWKGMAPPPPVEVEPEFERVPAPDWVDGCYECSRGVLSSKPLLRDRPLYEEWLQQARDGDLKFCTCKTGTALRSFLLRTHKREQEFHKELAMAANALRGSKNDRRTQS